MARLLGERGAEIIDADRLGHAVLAPGGVAADQVADRWPSVVVDGQIDRRALGRIVFADPAALAALEAMTHPEIRRLIGLRIETSDSEVVVVEIPIPARWLDPTWRRVVVDVDDAIRLSRLLDRGMTSEEIEQRMAVQPSRDEWQALADDLVANDGDLHELGRAVDRIWAGIEDPPVRNEPPHE